MLEWLIVGGGIHGTYLSFYLTRVKGVARESLRVLDPFEEPLARWNARAANTGMAYLRSPHAHNLDHDPWSISTFASTRAGRPLARYIPLHNRPSLELFQAHARWLIERHRLAELRIVGRARALERIDGGWRVQTETEVIDARRVILAIGMDENAYWPDWARALRDEGAKIDHVLAADFDRLTLPDWTSIAVVGGGISAAQTALALAERAPGRVTLIMRHAPRIHDFDSDTTWIAGPKVAEFQREPDYVRRSAIIREARNRGSMPPDVFAALNDALDAESIKPVEAEVMAARVEGGDIRLDLSSGAGELAVERVVLATGFDSARPGGAWLDRAIADYNLPVASNGYPLVDRALRWSDGLFVSGALAELEIGPVARNLIGARLAAERIAKAPSPPTPLPQGEGRKIITASGR